MIAMTKAEIRSLLESNFMTEIYPADDINLNADYSHFSNENAYELDELQIFRNLQGVFWYELQSSDFCYGFLHAHWEGEGVAKECPLYGSLSRLKGKTWCYYLPGILWVLLKEIEQRSKLGMLLDYVPHRLTMGEKSKMKTDDFLALYGGMSHGQKQTIAECLVYIGCYTKEDHGPFDVPEFVALNSYWKDYLSDVRQSELVVANII